MKLRFVLLLSLIAAFSVRADAQAMTTHYDEISAAQKKLEPAIKDFGSCILTHDLNPCIQTLLKKATDPYTQYAIAGLMAQVDSAVTFDLHRKAYTAQPDEEILILEYAIELHRSRQYEEAASLYEKYATQHPKEFTVHVWLADCYMNLDKVEKAQAEWTKADHAANHTGVDRAINTIYGKHDQIRRRDNLRKELTAGKTNVATTLIVLDLNWPVDPWSKVIEEDMLQADLALVRQKTDTNSTAFKTLKTYIAIKRLGDRAPRLVKDSIKLILKKAQLILDGKAIPADGTIASGMVQFAITAGLLDAKELYKSKGEEILKMAQVSKDPEMLNLYAHLQTSAKDAVDPAIDKMGWKEFKDERFAVSYFMGKSDRNRYDDPELAQALTDFPGSPILYWVKVNCAKIEKKPLHPMLIELIKREFKTLGSDPNHMSYGLNSYFGYLATEK